MTRDRAQVLTQRTPFPLELAGHDLLHEVVGEETTLAAQLMLAANSEDLAWLESFAEDSLHANRTDEALRAFQVAGHHAWSRHAGVFSSPRIENSIPEIAARLPSRASSAETHPRTSNRICHIVTRAWPVGGHTKLLVRWIRTNAEMHHDVVLTDQMGWKVPKPLVEAVRDSGGIITDVQRLQASCSSRIAAIAVVAREADGVVLHIHPYDVMALAALTGLADAPPVLFMNHADHVFWIGASVADSYVHTRDIAVGLSTERRGIPSELCSVLPIPVDYSPVSAAERSAARERLGLPGTATVALTIASGYKCAKIGTLDFARHHAELAKQHSNFLHLVIGQSENPRWQRQTEASNNRLRAIAPTPAIIDYLRAADFYVDSYPLASVTSYLEAGAMGLPIVSFDPWRAQARVILAPEPVIRVGESKFLGRDQYDNAFHTLATDPAHRSSIGQSTAERIIARHGTNAWAATLDNVWTGATRPGKKPPSAITPTAKAGELIDALLVLLNPLSSRPGHTDPLLFSGLPLRARLALARRWRVSSIGWMPERAVRTLITLREQWRNREKALRH